MLPYFGVQWRDKETGLARNNYGFQKRSRELAKKKKKEEKRLRKQGKLEPEAAESPAEAEGQKQVAEIQDGPEAAPAGTEDGPTEGDR